MLPLRCLHPLFCPRAHLVPDHVPFTTLSKPGIYFLIDNRYHVCPDIPFVIAFVRR